MRIKDYFALFIICLIAWLITVAVAKGDMGRAVYSMNHPDFRCNAFFRSMRARKEIEISVLWNTFGNDTRCLSRVLKDSRLRLVEIHLTNGSCIRMGRCGSYEMFGRYSVTSLKRVLRSNSSTASAKFKRYGWGVATYLAARLPQRSGCAISPMLESNLDPVSARVLVGWTKEVFAGLCGVVWNPMGRVYNVGQDISETHREPKSGLICSNDGDPLTLNYAKDSRICETAFLWTPADNCITSSQFIDPRQRSCVNQPAEFQRVADIMRRTS